MSVALLVVALTERPDLHDGDRSLLHQPQRAAKAMTASAEYLRLLRRHNVAALSGAGPSLIAPGTDSELPTDAVEFRAKSCRYRADCWRAVRLSPVVEFPVIRKVAGFASGPQEARLSRSRPAIAASAYALPLGQPPILAAGRFAVFAADSVLLQVDDWRTRRFGWLQQTPYIWRSAGEEGNP